MISIIDVPNANSDLFVNHNDNLQLTSAQKKPGVGEPSTKKASKRKKKLKMMQKRRQKCIAIGVDIDYDSEYDKCVDYDLESLKQYDRLAGSISSDSSVNNVNDFDDLPSNDYTEIDEFSDFDDFKETSSTTRGGSKTCPEGELQKIERRTKVQRRRQIDPTTCERDYTDAEVEFMKALEEYKRSSGRMFPTCSEILEVLLKLGYAKHEMKDESMAKPPMYVEPEQFPTITTPMFTDTVLPTDTIGVNTEPTAERTPLFDDYAMMY